MNKIAIAHGSLDARGGSEALAVELARMFDSPLFVGHKDVPAEFDESDIDIHEIAPSSHYHRLMSRGSLIRTFGHLLHWRDNAPDALSEYDTIITSGQEPLWALTRDQQTVVAYTHSPPRSMYDLNHESNGLIARTYQQFQRRLYEGSVKRPDIWVANSDLVARRIQKYWNISDEQVEVAYPPVETSNYSTDIEPTGDLYLYLGRLTWHKRVDEVIEAFNRLEEQTDENYRLVIAGTGSKRKELESLAADNIEFLGYVSEDQKRRLYASAKALIFPAQNEDFGMVPIEAMAAGTPVIGIEEGFTQFQVIDGMNGFTYNRRGNDLCQVIHHFEDSGVTWSENTISKFARINFDTKQFQNKIRNVVYSAKKRSRIEPELEHPEDNREASQ